MEPRAPCGPSRVQILLWCGILASLLALSLFDYRSFQIGVYRDDASYLVLSRSLLETESYGFMNEPGAPAATWYPFGYPLLLAPVARLFPPNADAVKLLSLLATVANASLCFWGWRAFSRNASYGWSLAVVALYATSPLVIEHTRMVMSEPVFLTSCLLTTLLADRAARGKEGRLWPVGMGVALVFTVFVRTIGLVVAVPALVWIVWARGRAFVRSLALAAGVAILLTAACVAATSLDTHSLVPFRYAAFVVPEETGAIPSLASRAAAGAREYAGRHLADLLFQAGPDSGALRLAERLGVRFLPATLGLLALAAILVGLVAWRRAEGPSLVLLTSVAYGGVLLIWPFRGTRFLYPIQPWMTLMLLYGIGSLLDPRLRRARPGVPRPIPRSVVALTLVLAVTGLIASARIPDTRPRVGDRSAATEWLRANAPETAVVVSENPQTDFLYGARKTVPVPLDFTEESLATFLRERRATHVLISPDLRWRDSFRPEWGDRGRRVAAALNRMALAGSARVAHDEPTSGVRVYAVGR